MKKIIFVLVLCFLSITSYCQDLTLVNFDKVIDKSFAVEMYKRYMSIWDMSVNAKSHKDVVKNFSEIGFLEWNYIKRRNGELMLFEPDHCPDVIKRYYLPIQDRYLYIDISTEDHGIIHPSISITIDNKEGKSYYTMLNVFLCLDFHRIGKLRTYNTEDGYSVITFSDGREMTIRTYDRKRFVSLDIHTIF